MSSPRGAASLSTLVKNNDLTQIKEVVRELKATNDWRWQHNDERELYNAVRDAILLGQLETVRYFLQQGLHVNAHPYASGNSGYVLPLIAFAAKSGNLAMVQLLVEHGAEIKPHNSYYNKDDDNGIRAAVKGGHPEIVDYLLQHGANAGGVFGGMRRDTFIAHAAKKGRIRIVEALIKHGAKVENSFGLAVEKYRERISSYQRALANNYGDNNKQQITLKLNKYINAFDRIVKTLLDYAVGTDFSPGKHRGLTFLDGMNVSGFNFIGVSVNGKPVTREMLKQLNIEGADNAIITEDDLIRLHDTDLERYRSLRAQVNQCIQKKGLLYAAPGIYNFIPLARAAEIGDEAAAIARLEAGVDPNESGDIGHPLILAAENGHLAIVRKLVAHHLLDKKAIVTAQEKAAENGKADLVAFLQTQTDVNMLDNKGNTLLHNAAEKGDVDQVLALIARGADVNLENKNGATALKIAAENSGGEWGKSKKHTEVIKVLLAHRADANKYTWSSPLELAFKGGNAESAALLLPRTEKKDLAREDYRSFEKKIIGYDPWYVDMMFEAIHKESCIKLLTLLADEGVDFNHKSEHGDTLLNSAVDRLPSFSNITSTMRGLVRAGYDAPRCGDALERTQQELIAKSKEYLDEELKILDFLFAHGCDARISGGRDERTPLALLIAEKDLSHLGDAAELVMERFVQRGSEVNAVDKYGNTPLHEAARTGDIPAIKFLVKRGAQINVQNHQKLTPLHLAAARGNVSSTKLLMELGADHAIKDEDDLTPVELSKKSMQEEKKCYKFNSWQAEREFERKYIEAQQAISNTIWTQQSAIRENAAMKSSDMEIDNHAPTKR